MRSADVGEGGRVRGVTLVLITGATRGIGRAAAVELAGEGVEVALVGRDPERVKEVAVQARAAGGGATVHEHVADLMLMAEVRALAQEVRERYEHIDVLANNAGALFASRGGDLRGPRADFCAEPPCAVPTHEPAARSS